jgi:plastocyanin
MTVAPEAGRAPAPTGDTAVAVQGFQFKPKVLQVPVGTRVVWTNWDEIEHTVTATADSGAAPVFDGALAGNGRSFAVVFDQAGTYAYVCARHTFMRGEIRVIAKGER